MKPISNDKKQRIIYYLGLGYSIRKVAEVCNVSKSLVHEIKSSNLTSSSCISPGRKKILSPQLEHQCIRLITSGSEKTTKDLAMKIKEDYGISVSRMTISRSLHNSGLSSHEKEEKPKLSKQNVKDQLSFANNHADWTADDWKNVIWSDETKINRFCSDGRSWYWARDNTSLKPDHVKQTIKHGGGSIIVWGCMTAKGPGYLCKIDGRMDQALYQQILEDELQKTIEHYNFKADDTIFQHDNCAIHKAKSITTYLQNQQYQVLEWPSQSPDLNPIEHLWSKLKRELNKYETAPKGMLELWKRIQEVWDTKISPEDCLALIESMPRRIEAVRAAKGWWTKY